MFVVVAVCLSDCVGWDLHERKGKKRAVQLLGVGIDDDDDEDGAY